MNDSHRSTQDILDLRPRPAAGEDGAVAVSPEPGGMSVGGEKYRVLFDTVPVGITVTNTRGRIIEMNREAGRILDLRPGEHLVERLRSQALRVVRPDGSPMPPKEYASVRALRERRRVENVEMGFVDRDGRTTWAMVNAAPLSLEGYGVVITYNDITGRKEAEAKSLHLALHDALTDLPNRRLFIDRMRQALSRAQRFGRSVALLYIDLDNFKAVNDSLGHEAGDSALLEITSRMRRSVREMDTLARIGGDEFALILQDLEAPGDACGVAAKLVEIVGTPVTVSGTTLRIGASIGVSFSPRDGQNVDELIRKADDAMYVAKRHGGGRFRFCTE